MRGGATPSANHETDRPVKAGVEGFKIRCLEFRV